jgi:hypothetical protein
LFNCVRLIVELTFDVLAAGASDRRAIWVHQEGGHLDEQVFGGSVSGFLRRKLKRQRVQTGNNGKRINF